MHLVSQHCMVLFIGKNLRNAHAVKHYLNIKYKQLSPLTFHCLLGIICYIQFVFQKTTTQRGLFFVMFNHVIYIPISLPL